MPDLKEINNKVVKIEIHKGKQIPKPTGYLVGVLKKIKRKTNAPQRWKVYNPTGKIMFLEHKILYITIKSKIIRLGVWI